MVARPLLKLSDYPWPLGAWLRFISETVWEEDLGSLWEPRQLAYAGCRVLFIVGRAFVSARVQVQAAALTYNTLLALVPMFAVVFALFKPYSGLKEAESRLRELLFASLAPAWQADFEFYLNDFASKIHEGAGGVMTGMAVCFLFYSVIMMLSTIEHTLNQIWGAKRSRSLFRRLTTYWFVATLGPILLGVSLTMSEDFASQLSSFSVRRVWRKISAAELDERDLARGGLGGTSGAATSAHVQGIRGDVVTAHADGPQANTISRLTALILVTVAFTLLYAFMPNMRVRLGPAITGALIAALLWHLSKFGFTESSTRLIRANKVYGSLSALPLTMFWIYISWVIVILGAEISHAAQNVRTHRREELAPLTSHSLREELALRIVATTSYRFSTGLEPPSVTELTEELGAPIGLVSELAEHLALDGMLLELSSRDERDIAYLPARPLSKITVADVLQSLRERAGVSYALRDGGAATTIRDQLKEASRAINAATATTTFEQVTEQAIKANEKQASAS